jgi:ribosome biogenesis GTPase
MTAADRPDAPTARPGRVVARFRQETLVENECGAMRLRCLIGGRRLSPVVGDRVSFRPGPDGEAGVVTAIEPRRNCLARIDRRGREEAVAANLATLVVVVARKPPPDLALADRYLAAAETLRLDALIAANKSDLPAPAGWTDTLAEYRLIGYPVVELSARDGDVRALADALTGGIAVLVGQSGVGKSSLLNALVPNAGQTTAGLSGRSGEGRHTTTTAVLHRLPGGGALVDSPGVRDYSPPLPPPREVQVGYREIRAAAPGCRFADCLHRREPDCAVKAAVENGRIGERRYRSYLGLLALAERLAEASG